MFWCPKGGGGNHSGCQLLGVTPVNASGWHCIRPADVLFVPSVSGLDGNSSVGPNDIHPLPLMSCSSELAYPLLLIFSLSLKEGSLLPCGKCLMLSPYTRLNLGYDPLNDCPVSLTLVCCTSMELITVSHLISYLEGNEILSEDQFGFSKGRSTEDQLLLTYGDVSLGGSGSCCGCDSFGLLEGL